MKIFENAVTSIALGIEDFDSNDQRRLISCTRNLFAGIMLLFKHRLAQLSPPGSDEALIKQRVLPVQISGGIEWQGQGKKTVDVQQIEDRFGSLGITVDWKRIRKINDYRNDIEHYHSNLSHSAVRGLIADCFLVIRDFVRMELQLDPPTVFGAATWRILTEVTEVHESEKKVCLDHIDAIDWRYDALAEALREVTCPACASSLVDAKATGLDRTSTSFACLSCGEEFDFQKLASHAMSEYFRWENHRSMQRGGELATIDCPNCGKRNSYLLDQDVCVICDESAPRVCSMCGCDIPSSEIDGEGLCGYCAHILSKDD